MLAPALLFLRGQRVPRAVPSQGLGHADGTLRHALPSDDGADSQGQQVAQCLHFGQDLPHLLLEPGNVGHDVLGDVRRGRVPRLQLLDEPATLWHEVTV